MADSRPRQQQRAPDGWYGALTSQKLRRGRAVSFRALGRDLVAWRGMDGVAHVIDRYCPHQGAALDKGRVQGDRIVCPFHAWEFGSGGHCVGRPDFYKTAISARVGAYATVERDGVVWFHSDPTTAQGDEALFPAVASYLGTDDGAFGRTHVVRKCFRGSQMGVLENTMDLCHLVPVHGQELRGGSGRVTRNDTGVFAFEMNFRLGGGRFEVPMSIEMSIHDGTLLIGNFSIAGRECSRWIASAMPDGAGGLTVLQPYVTAKLEGWWRLANPVLALGMGRGISRGLEVDAKIWSEQSRAEGHIVPPEERVAEEFRRYYAALLEGRDERDEVRRGSRAEPSPAGWVASQHV